MLESSLLSAVLTSPLAVIVVRDAAPIDEADDDGRRREVATGQRRGHALHRRNDRGSIDSPVPRTSTNDDYSDAAAATRSPSTINKTIPTTFFLPPLDHPTTSGSAGDPTCAD